MSVAAVIFDVDGTLIDYDGAARDGLTAHLALLGSALDETAWQHWRAVEEHHFARYLGGELTFQDQRRERVREFTGETLHDDAADAWFDGYRRCFEQSWRLFDDVVDTLDRLDGTPLAAFSNVSGEYTRHKLRQVGLIDRFVVSWGVDDVGVAKPDPRMFAALLAQLGVPASDAVHVGDRYAADALGACEAGLRGVWLDRLGAHPAGRRPDGDTDRRVVTIGSLHELVAITRV